MTITDFISDVEKKHRVTISLYEDNLKIHFDENSNTDVAIELIKSRKKEIVDFLKLHINDSKTYTSKIVASEKKEYYELSSPQMRLYYLQQNGIDNVAYNMPYILDVDESIDLNKIEEIFIKIINKHEILRTSFIEIDSIPYQKIHDDLNFKLEIYKKEKGENLNDLIRPFNLLRDKLIRVIAIIDNKITKALFIDIHHIIADGISIKKLISEFNTLSRNFRFNNKTLHYKDYVGWVNKIRKTDFFKKKEDYWLSIFKESPPLLELPTDFTRPQLREFKGGREIFSLSKKESEMLKGIMESYGLTPFMLYISIYYLFLNKISNSEDIVIGFPVYGRNNSSLEDIVGMFINMVCLRLNISTSDLMFSDLLMITKEKVVGAIEKQDYLYEDLLNIVKFDFSPGRNPIFDVSFVFQDISYNKLELSESESKVIDVETNSTKFDLTLQVDASQTITNLMFEYDTNLFKNETIVKFKEYFKQIVTGITRNLGKLKLSDIDIISDREKQKLLYDFNNTDFDYPKDKTIHQLFEEQVKRTPNNIALIYGDKMINYVEFNDMSNQVALELNGVGVDSGSIIGVMLDRSIEMMLGIMGTLKAGGTYLPIDLKYPKDRINYILKDSNAEVLISKANPGVESNLPIVTINHEQLIKKDTKNLKKKINPKSLSYIIYTSGSTGEPKGVIIEHHSVVNRIKWMQKCYPIDTKDIIVQKTPYTFDVSVWELFWWSFEGSSLSLLETGGEKDTSKIVQNILNNNVSIIHFVPSMLDIFLEYVLENNEINKLGSLRYVFASGEELKVNYVEKFNKVFGENSECKLVNLYGPTEATVDVTYFNCERKGRYSSIPIGKPIYNTDLYIIDQNNCLRPIGVSGELCIGGVGLSRGYLNNPELTRDKFVSHPFKEGDRLYRTGDLARWLPDGNIEFLGRIDNQVKIRGYRIELGETESCLLKHPEVQDSVVIAREDSSGDKYLCGYVVSNSDTGNLEESLRSYLLRYLPDYMVPGYIVRLDSIPLNSNGKIDRKSLPTPEIKAGSNYIGPKNLQEIKLVSIWSDVLDISKHDISTGSSFFELGGHSLKVTVLVSRIHKELGVQLDLSDIFENQTIQLQSALIKKSSQTTYFSIPSSKVQPYYTLSSSQRRLYLLHQMDLSSVAYNMPGVIAVPSGLSKSSLEDIFNILIARHETLRTRFEVKDEVPVQIIDEDVYFSIEEYKIVKEDLPGVQSRFIRPFDLSKSPLLRVGYVEVEDGSDLLLVDMHHIISDGRSQEVLTGDFSKLLQGEVLSELRLQYKDYSEWQNSLEQQTRLQGQKEYWVDMFKGEIPVLTLPTDYARPKHQDFSGSSVHFTLTEAETLVIREMSRLYGLTASMSLLSLYGILLSKLSNQEDLVIGLPVAARRHSDLDHIVGMFVNTLALRMEVSGNFELSDYLQKVKELSLSAYEHQEYQFEDLVDELVKERDTSRNPLFDVMFNYQSVSQDSDVIVESGLDHDHILGISKFDLSLTALDNGIKILLGFEYSTKLFNPVTIDRFICYFKELIFSLSDIPKPQIKDLNILSESEKHQLLYEFNDTESDYPKDKTIHQLFEEQVERTPDRVALVFQDEILTYQELNKRSNQLAHLLLKKGFSSELVGILLNRSINTLISILGILKSGNAYVPIDARSPQLRINYLIKDSGIRVLLSEENVQKEQNNKIETIDISDIQTIDKEKEENPEVRDTFNAYLLYTSGSTGVPKGVLVKNQSVVNLLSFLNSNYGFKREDVHLFKTSYVFDVSVSELYGWILSGGQLSILPDGSEKNPHDILSHISRYQVSYINFVPSMFSSFLQELEGTSRFNLSTLKYIFIVGEALQREHTERFQKVGTGINLENLYGPTETTVYTTIEKEDKLIPIRKGVYNSKHYILDSNNNLQPIGVVGELCISGDCLTLGYLNKPELTSEKFVSHPFKEGDRLYRTGDLARWLPDGNIEFLGRIDNQVKFRGYRIELGEIESCLLEHPEVQDSVVIAREDNSGDKYLCGYVVSNSDTGNLEESLRSHLLRYLPDYMVPAYFVELEELPLTANGKINHKLLPAPKVKIGDNYKEPPNEIEKKLVQIWSEILNIPKQKIGVETNFFEIGGHSLKVFQLISIIENEFGVSLPFMTIYQSPNIKLLGNDISSKHFIDTNVDINLLNGNYNRKVFCFPPAISFGIAYQSIADFFYDISFYSFNYILDNDRINQYVNYLLNIQENGPFILFAYSGGWKLAFEVTNILNRLNKSVSDIILLDSNYVIKSDTELNDELNQYITFVERNIDSFNLSSQKEKIINSIKEYNKYLNEPFTPEIIDTNIHHIYSNVNKDPFWLKKYSKEFNIYQGKGSHEDMIEGQALIENSRIIREILNKII